VKDGAPIRELLRRVPLVEEGDRLGFTDVWLSEHRFGDEGYLPSPLVVRPMRLLFASEAALKVRSA
jgi:alkanesulfonate monooxygenase SsuD/methylene tetrahydromethanopterin reductase-like flavin-dependent oxidoreductase (luciferase family)